MRAAMASGDISTLIKLMTKTAQLTPDDYITKIIGFLRYFYYSYVKYFHVRPKDMLDLADGILFVDARGYVEELQWKQEEEKIRAQTRKT